MLASLQAEMPGFRWEPAADPKDSDFAFSEADIRAPLDLSRLRSDLPEWQLRDLGSGIADYAAWHRTNTA